MISFARRTVAAGMLFFAFVSFWPALKKEHSGLAKVIDAGAIEISGERHRLYGLHAIELAHTCRRRDGSAWPCGKEAAGALAKFIGGRKVMCEPHGRDGHGQYLSICYAGRDHINAWVVREGWATANPDAPRMGNSRAKKAWPASCAAASGRPRSPAGSDCQEDDHDPRTDRLPNRNPSPHSTGPLSDLRAAFDPVRSLHGRKTWEPAKAP